MTVAIIDYGSGNLHSAVKAFEFSAREAGVATKIELTDDPDVIANADRIVLPGVGAFADCKSGLSARDGVLDALTECVMRKGRPFFGICVGMQLMATRGLEHGVTDGLGWIPGEVAPIEPRDPSLKVPHMGWNTLTVRNTHPVLAGIPVGENGLHAYFVHSFHLRPVEPLHCIAEADYGGFITAMVGRDNMIGTQFHPEKSQKLGLALIANFLRWKP